MGTQSRKEYLKVLEIFYDSEPFQTHTKFNHVLREALKYAIASIKTDLKYDLMFEGEDIYTKADMIAILTELKEEIDIMSDTVVEDRTVTITSWLGMQKRISKLIQSKIDKLKEGGNKNGNE